MLYVILILAVLGLDQWSKAFMVDYLTIEDPRVIVDGFFKLTMVHNRGAAFGVLQHQKWLFLLITAVAVCGIIYLLIKEKDRWKAVEKASLALIAGGALGNAADRIRLDYVVDFLSFRLFGKYDFPVFNVADIAICVGVALMLISVLRNQEKHCE